MTQLRFAGEAVLELLEHARAAERHFKPYEPDVNPGPGLLLVKDEGIYLMSNGRPGLMVTEPGGRTHHRVVYAEGYHPDLPDRHSQYEKIRDAVGGDDFAEFLPIEGDLTELKREQTLIFEVTAVTIRVLIEG